MAKLYKNLFRLKESLTTFQNLTPNDSKRKENTQKSNCLPLHKENLKVQLEECCKETVECSQSLFDLTLIVPSAPWTSIKKSPIEQLTEAGILQKLKSIGLPKLKYQSVEVLMKSFFVATNYHNHMKSLEVLALGEEVKFYRSCYALQKSYIESLMTLFKNKYESFLEELKQSFNEPLKMLIKKFWLMKVNKFKKN